MWHSLFPHIRAHKRQPESQLNSQKNKGVRWLWLGPREERKWSLPPFITKAWFIKCDKESLHKHEENSASRKSRYLFPIKSCGLWIPVLTAKLVLADLIKRSQFSVYNESSLDLNNCYHSCNIKVSNIRLDITKASNCVFKSKTEKHPLM